MLQRKPNRIEISMEDLSQIDEEIAKQNKAGSHIEITKVEKSKDERIGLLNQQFSQGFSANPSNPSKK